MVLYFEDLCIKIIYNIWVETTIVTARFAVYTHDHVVYKSCASPADKWFLRHSTRVFRSLITNRQRFLTLSSLVEGLK